MAKHDVMAFRIGPAILGGTTGAGSVITNPKPAAPKPMDPQRCVNEYRAALLAKSAAR